jgi:hypothetical protein
VLLAIVFGMTGCHERGPNPSSGLTGVAERDIDGELRSAPANIEADEAF